jgi:hypothetical protein
VDKKTPLPIGTHYTHKDKAIRNDLIRQYWYAHPDAKLGEVAKIFGLHTTRIWAIVHRKQRRKS